VANDQKVNLATTYLNDVGDIWFQGWSGVREGYSWDEFSRGLCKRFGERRMVDIVEEFNKLKQIGTIIEYLLKFEELKSLMLHRNPYLTNEYFVLSFISGLSDDLRSMVEMMRPRSVQEAIEDALLQELTVEALMKRQRGQNKGMNPRMVLSGGRVKYLTNEPHDSSLPLREKLIEQGRIAGLCFWCEDRYTPGRQCKK